MRAKIVKQVKIADFGRIFYLPNLYEKKQVNFDIFWDTFLPIFQRSLNVPSMIERKKKVPLNLVKK